MKFIKLESRGGNYLVVAENVAWLRTAENGQTSVGIIGGQPLLVVGSIEEVAEKILNSAGQEDATAAAPAPVALPAPAPAQAAAAAPPPPAPAAAAVPIKPAPRPAVQAGATLSERLAAAAAAPKVKAGTQRFMGGLD
jgi:hypothetical protein